MKKVLIVDWLDKYGGAERVIKDLYASVQFDKVYTMVNVMERSDLENIFPGLKYSIITSPLQRFGFKFRLFFFLFWNTIEKIQIDTDSQLIFSSSHAVAKGINKSNKNQIHISYFQAPNANYIWDEAPIYFGKFYFFIKPMLYFLRKKDISHGQKPDFIIANSKFVQNWIKEKYNRNSVVIYPPINLSDFTLKIEKEDYYIAVGRIVHIKRFDIIIDAFNKNKKKLIIVGDGELLNRIRKRSNDNIFFKGFAGHKEINHLIGSAKAFIQAGIEGFGIAPLEAQACGTPVIAYRKGGVTETVIENETGIFFDTQSAESLINAITLFESKSFNPISISNHAHQFTEERFKNEIAAFIKSKIKN
ncbi:glycosyltransferase [Myroides indicus]|uniref:Glycosyltransferase involved in cell wall biosynthesis n=1 Tax=Myroides indicus TaxID=1323422 RepID=A0A4R7F3R9_9FLAO|nr:glycosyltransferase [Myroides indicus]TDS58129.1 glycosyltransferase involved in cell wall biosynthesis [Myroides indicus]